MKFCIGISSIPQEWFKFQTIPNTQTNGVTSPGYKLRESSIHRFNLNNGSSMDIKYHSKNQRHTDPIKRGIETESLSGGMRQISWFPYRQFNSRLTETGCQFNGSYHSIQDCKCSDGETITNVKKMTASAPTLTYSLNHSNPPIRKYPSITRETSWNILECYQFKINIR